MGVIRVVAGSARGRALRTPDGRDVRPTSARVRAAVFNALGSLGEVVDAEMVDLFAGTGALGIEALSRGAGHVVFVDRSRAAAAVVRDNLAACGLGADAEVVVADALAHARTMAPVDVALCDPPYDFDAWDELLAVVPAEVVVVESDRDVEPGPDGAVLSRRRHGGTVVTMISFPGRASRGRPPTEVDL